MTDMTRERECVSVCVKEIEIESEREIFLSVGVLSESVLLVVFCLTVFTLSPSFQVF